jgi:hypothetical protein
MGSYLYMGPFGLVSFYGLTSKFSCPMDCFERIFLFITKYLGIKLTNLKIMTGQVEGASAGPAGGKREGRRAIGLAGARKEKARTAEKAQTGHLAAAAAAVLTDTLPGPPACRAVVGRRNPPRPPGQLRQESSFLWDGCYGTSRKAIPSTGLE